MSVAPFLNDGVYLMSEFTKQNVFSMPITTPTYDTGADRSLRLSALLRWQQEAGGHHAEKYGMGWEALAAEDLAFVLVGGCGVIHRMPRCGERVVLETWSDRVAGPRFYRGYRVCDGEGRRLTESMGVFVLMNLSTRRLHRPTEEDIRRLPPTAVREDSACPLPSAVKVPLPLSKAAEWTVPASAVDFNLHLNNTVYADLLLDFLPPEQRHAAPRAYALQYHAEAREDDPLSVFWGEQDGTAFVEVRRGDTLCFAGSATF